MPPRAIALLLVVMSAAAIGGVAVASDSTIGTHQTIEIAFQSDGDARWQITTRLEFRNESDRVAFDRVAKRYETGAIESKSLSAARTAADAAAEATGREMAIVDVTRSAERRDGGGEFTVSFTWKNFARVEDDAIHIGDAFQTDDRWLSHLGPNQTLVVDTPPGYGPTDWPYGVENGKSRIEGPHSFESGALSGEFVGGVGLEGLGWVPAVLVVFGAIVGVGWWLYARGPDRSSESTASPVSPDSDADPDLELLSDEERVEALLDRNGGRMKQAAIVEETGWSNAKVSQLLSEMAEEGRIDKLRIGRENLISAPDEDFED
ncbi:MAG: helix-turn-helix transcriptional regulator [Halococcoides sp.]